MKKNAIPLLSASWWNSNEPDGLSSGKELHSALNDYEAALKTLEKDGKVTSKTAVDKALDKIEQAVKKVQSDAEKTLKNPPKDPKKAKFDEDDWQYTVDALKKFGKVIDAARKDAEGMIDEDEEDDEKTLLGDPKLYQAFLRKSLMKLKQRMLNFAIGLGKQANESRILLHKAKPGKALVAAIKQETDLKRMTWGIAGAHAEKPNILVLALEGPQAPGLKRKAEKLLKAFKPLPFNKVMLMVEGEEVEDIQDPATLEEDWNAYKAELYPTITRAVSANHPAREDLVRLMGLADKAAGGNDYAAAFAHYDEIEKLLDSEADATDTGSTTDTPAAAPSAENLAAAMTKWQSARESAVVNLKNIAKEIAAAKHAESAKALIELNAVIKNLTPEPKTLQQVSELERYLGTDDVVMDVCELAEDIRTPLLKVLSELRTQLAA